MREIYNPKIGLEIHLELSTLSKIFCSCSADHFNKKPNTQVCPICLGLPGALPYLNKSAVESTIKLGLALGCKVSLFSKFDRKHYFYPDLPKGYQISQYDLPFCQFGQWKDDLKHRTRIRRVHLEEDTAKLVHTDEKTSLIDFNRSGVPLVELVTEPDFNDTESVILFVREIQVIARYLSISTGDMEKGSLRLEANISLTTAGLPANAVEPDYKVELKNINSFKFLDKALKAEIRRQQKLLENGQKVIQETRGFNEKSGETYTLRLKEGENDYRYFPEPDIPPIRLTNSEINRIRKSLPEMPQQKKERFGRLFDIPDAYLRVLIKDPFRAKYFEDSVKLAIQHKISPMTIAQLIINQQLDRKYSNPSMLIKKIIQISKRNYASESEIELATESVLKEQKKAVDDFKKGKGEVIGYLIGMVQKTLKGQGNPQEIRKHLIAKLNNGVK